MNPTISIIIPVYNQEKYLSRCLDSILVQTFTDFEVICVDDFSTDKSAEILNEYVQKDSRIVALKNIQKGVCSARNYGIDNAKGEYIGFVDSDDFIQPQMYEFMLKAIKESNRNMVVCGYEEMESYQRKNFVFSTKEVKASDYAGDAYNWGKDEMILSGVWSKLIKTSFLKQNARFEDFRVGQDMVFCAMLWVKEPETVLVNLPLYGYFIDPQSSCHRIYEEKHLSIMRARYATHKIYSQQCPELASYFLFKSFFFLVKCKTENLVTKKDYKKIMNKYFFKMLIPFVFAKGLSLKEKLFYIVKYLKG